MEAPLINDFLILRNLYKTPLKWNNAHPINFILLWGRFHWDFHCPFRSSLEATIIMYSESATAPFQTLRFWKNVCWISNDVQIGLMDHNQRKKKLNLFAALSLIPLCAAASRVGKSRKLFAYN